MADLRISDLTAHSTGVLANLDLIEVSEESGGTYTSRKMTGAQLAATVDNFANADLTFTGSRDHDTAGFDLYITTDGGVGAESLFSFTPLGVTLRSYNGLKLGGSITKTYSSYVTTHTITATDNIVDCTSGTFTVTLPTALNIAGRQYIIKNSGAGTITLEGDGTETIDGSLNVSIATKKCYTVVSDNANWIIINLF